MNTSMGSDLVMTERRRIDLGANILPQNVVDEEQFNSNFFDENYSTNSPIDSFSMMGPSDFDQLRLSDIEETLSIEQDMDGVQSNFSEFLDQNAIPESIISEKGDTDFTTASVLPNRSMRVTFETQVENIMLTRYEIISTGDNLMIYQPEEGYFRQMTDRDVAVLIRKSLTDDQDRLVRKQKIDEIIYRLKTHPELQRELNQNNDPGLINFRNGVYDLFRQELIPHNSHYCFTRYIDADYDSYLNRELHIHSCFQSSNFLRFLEDCTNGEELKMKSLQQMVGYIISNHTRAKKMFILIGKPHTGKSVWLSLLQNLVGIRNTTSMTLKQLAENRFMQSRLAHSQLNISPEMSEDTDLKGIEFIKAVTGGDLITGDRKGEAPIDFRGQTKLVAAGNHMPKISRYDGTNAFMDRLMFITFNLSTPEHKRDRFLLDKLLEERSLIVQWALEGLHELIENNFKFIECDDGIQFKRQYMNELSNFSEFIYDMCYIEPHNLELKVHRKMLYEAYKEYCKDNASQVLTKTELWREVEKLEVKSEKLRIEGSNPLMGFRGIALK